MLKRRFGTKVQIIEIKRMSRDGICMYGRKSREKTYKYVNVGLKKARVLPYSCNNPRRLAKWLISEAGPGTFRVLIWRGQMRIVNGKKHIPWKRLFIMQVWDDIEGNLGFYPIDLKLISKFNFWREGIEKDLKKPIK